jgi:aspartyl-tRNA(Asn)/glutamyl-tRNA(Gln) amidotransferase subunit A
VNGPADVSSALSAIGTAAAIRAGDRSAEEVVREALERLESEGRELRAVITVCADEALARVRGGVSGRLAGVPLLVKDLIDTAGIRTTYASTIYADHVPRRTASAIARLEAEGAIVVGKANADEFAWGVIGQNQHYGDVVNPAHPGKVTGGSSGGNAAALAAGIVPLAIGTDTGGSVRLPAAGCDIVGLKPALGSVPGDGVFPLATSFDVVGPMARTVADCALAHAVMAGMPMPVAEAGAASLAGVRVGVLTSPPLVTPPVPGPPASRDSRADGLVERFRALGAVVSEVSMPTPAHDTWPVFHADAIAAHAATFPSRAGEYGRTIRAKLEVAAREDPAAITAARAALTKWREQARHEPGVDLVVSPTIGLHDLPAIGVDELEVRLGFSVYARVFSYLGWPALALGGLQIAGRDTALVLAAGQAVEAAG